MSAIINIVSIISAFGFGVGCLYLLMDATIGRIKVLHSKFEWLGFQIKDFVFLILAVIFLLSNFSFVRPL
jgi:Na+-driven multidrug efflux pump